MISLMKAASPNIFDENYFYNVCLGSEEFKKSKGKKLHPRVKKMIDNLDLKKDMDILEIGCGRGDVAMYISSKVNSVVGIDYSKTAIKIANEIKSSYSNKLQKRAKFKVMEATKLSFKDSSFDMVIFIDTLDHLSKTGITKSLKEIKRVLKPNGKLFIKTCSNRILLSYTFKYFVYPMNLLLTGIDKIIKGVDYSPLPRDPRTNEAKIQHVNEPDYFYLKKMFLKNGFNASISADIGFIKESNGYRSHLYNFLITLYPLSKYYPLNTLFAYSFICKLNKV